MGAEVGVEVFVGVGLGPAVGVFVGVFVAPGVGVAVAVPEQDCGVAPPIATNSFGSLAPSFEE